MKLPRLSTSVERDEKIPNQDAEHNNREQEQEPLEQRRHQRCLQ
jgi:hypothetical protein